jgi:predicted pyridoxine 5'-phosphate oxidase superfamily flavin-nucleotide-binding protein
LLSSLDAAGRPWASFVASVPGFIDVPDPRTLVIHARPLPGDVLSEQLEVGAQLGLLGIELHTRRRNRANGWLRAIGPDSFTLHVAQSFGNCPKHITPRAPRALVPRPLSVTSTGFEREGPRLSLRAQALIAEADTFFIASAAGTTSQHDARQGLDVSHRGGPTGFVSVEQTPAASVLSFLDYNGNNVFNTLGNIAVNPRAGLLFIDFDKGDLLYLAVTAAIVWDGPELRAFEGAQRLLRMQIVSMRRVEGALPLRWGPAELSPYLGPAGRDWR